MRARCDYQILIILYFVDNVHSPVHTQRRVAHVGEWLASWQRPPPVSPPLLSPGCPGPCVTTDGVTRPPGARTRRAAPRRPDARVNIFYKCASIETFWADQCALKINNIAPCLALVSRAESVSRILSALALRGLCMRGLLSVLMFGHAISDEDEMVPCPELSPSPLTITISFEIKHLSTWFPPFSGVHSFSRNWREELRKIQVLYWKQIALPTSFKKVILLCVKKSLELLPFHHVIKCKQTLE